MNTKTRTSIGKAIAIFICMVIVFAALLKTGSTAVIKTSPVRTADCL
jgi:hypothetical protein